MKLSIKSFTVFTFSLLISTAAVAQQTMPPEFFPGVRKLLLNPIPEEAVTRFDNLLKGTWKMSCSRYEGSGANFELTMEYNNGELLQTFLVFESEDTQCSGESKALISKWKYYLYLPNNNIRADQPYNDSNPPTAWSVYLELVEGRAQDPEWYWDLAKIEGDQLTLSAETGSQTIPQTYFAKSFTKQP